MSARASSPVRVGWQHVTVNILWPSGLEAGGQGRAYVLIFRFWLLRCFNLLTFFVREFKTTNEFNFVQSVIHSAKREAQRSASMPWWGPRLSARARAGVRAHVRAHRHTEPRMRLGEGVLKNAVTIRQNRTPKGEVWSGEGGGCMLKIRHRDVSLNTPFQRLS